MWVQTQRLLGTPALSRPGTAVRASQKEERGSYFSARFTLTEEDGGGKLCFRPMGGPGRLGEPSVLALKPPKEKEGAEGVTVVAAGGGGALQAAGEKEKAAAPLRLETKAGFKVSSGYVNGRLELLGAPVAFNVDGANGKVAAPAAGGATAGAASTLEGAVGEADEGGVLPGRGGSGGKNQRRSTLKTVLMCFSPQAPCRQGFSHANPKKRGGVLEVLYLGPQALPAPPAAALRCAKGSLLKLPPRGHWALPLP